jgi:hypothetical protein
MDGRHSGNSPEYNKSVREFDIVTMDRLKRIDVEPDYAVWKEYAWHYQVHGSILSYLDVRQQDFYTVESTSMVKLVTAGAGKTCPR